MAKVIGFEKYSFVPTGQTELIEGVTFYLVEKANEKRGSGLKHSPKLSLTNNKYSDFLAIPPQELVGKEINVFYDSWKKPAQIEILK